MPTNDTTPTAKREWGKHSGDCTIYSSMCNGLPEDGICTCGYGWLIVRKDPGNRGELYSKERAASMEKATPPNNDSFDDHLKSASKTVAAWPEWKQGLLGASTAPARRAPLTKGERDKLRKETLHEIASGWSSDIEPEDFLRLLDQVEALEEGLLKVQALTIEPPSNQGMSIHRVAQNALHPK